jgi:hypothetical protein
VFIDEVFDDFYKELQPGEAGNYGFGEIFKTHAYYPHENLEVWRPVTYLNEPTQTLAESFKIHPAGSDSFKHAHPLSSPKLESNEEQIVVRAKIRPVVLLTPEYKIEDVDTKGFRGRVSRKRCLVAQVYGLQDVNSGRAEFSPSFVDRVRRMEFPHLMFLPKRTGLFAVDSLLRFDECQSVFTPHLTPTRFAFNEDLRELIRSQFAFLLTNEYGGAYQLYREALLNE